MNGCELDISSSFTQLGPFISSSLAWKHHIHSIAKHASQKLGFLSRARGYFSPPQLLTIYKSQIRPSHEYCSHIWGGAPKFFLHLLDKVQSKATRLINNPNLSNSLQSLSHRRLVADLSIFYLYFHGHCSLEIKNIIPGPVRRVRTTRSSTQSHPFQVTLPNPRTLADKSTFIPRTSQPWNTLPSLLSPNPITYHPSNPTSTSLILSIYPLNLSLFSKFFLCRGIVVGPKAFPRHYILKKVVLCL